MTAAATASRSDWHDCPREIPDLPAVQPLPEHLIPPVIRPWMSDAVERLQVPAEMCVVPAVVAAGALLGRAVGVHPKRHDDWLVLGNPWGIIIGPPGILKTPALREGMRHVRRLAAEASQAHAELERDAAIDRKLITAQIKAVEKTAEKKNANIPQCRDDLTRLHDKLATLLPTERRYLTQDSTTEKLGMLLCANPRGLLVERDEIAGWVRQLEKAGREGDREFYLEAWNGIGSFSVDRVGRGTIHIPGLCISMLGTTQPAKVARLLVDHARDGSCDDGLIQRFGMAVWPDVPGTWRNVDRWPESDAREAAWCAYQALAADDVATRLGATAGDRGDIPTLRLADDALQLLNGFRSDLEHRLRSTSLDAWPAYKNHLAKYRSLVPAIALVTYALDVVQGRAESGAVSLDAVKLATEWSHFLEAHARRIYGVDVEVGRGSGRLLAKRILDGDILDCDHVRTIRRAEWSGLTSDGAIDEGLAYLEQLGWLRVDELATGGRRKRIVRLHPEIVARQPESEDAR